MVPLDEGIRRSCRVPFLRMESVNYTQNFNGGHDSAITVTLIVKLDRLNR